MYNNFRNQSCAIVNALQNDKNNENDMLFKNQVLRNDGMYLGKDFDKENLLLHLQIDASISCMTKPKATDSMNNECIGYECLPNSFLFDPDKENTYHNYLVLQDELDKNDNEVYCSKNHQIFENWTRRKNGFMLDTQSPEQQSGNLDIYYRKIPEVRYNKCSTNTDTNNNNRQYKC